MIYKEGLKALIGHAVWAYEENCVPDTNSVEEHFKMSEHYKPNWNIS